MLELLGAGVLVPAAVAALAVALAWRPWRRKPSREPVRAAGPVLALGLGAAYLVGHVGISGWPPLRPVESTQWLFYLVGAGSLLAAIETLKLPPATIRRGWRLLLASALLWLTASPLIRFTWSRTETALWLGGLLLYLALLAASDERACRESPLARLAVWIALAGGGAPVLLLSGSARLAQMLGAVAAVLTVPALTLLLLPDRALPKPALFGALVAAVGLALNGLFYTEMSPLAALFIALAPFAAWIARLPWVAALRPWQQAMVTATAVLLVLVPALLVAAADEPAPAGDDYYIATASDTRASSDLG